MTDYEQLRQQLQEVKGEPPSKSLDLPTFSESCIHQWAHLPHRYVSRCDLCGLEITELDRYQGLTGAMRKVYDLTSNPPKVNTGALVAAAWEAAVGRNLDSLHNLNNLFDVMKAQDEGPQMMVTSQRTFDELESLDVGRAQTFDKPSPEEVLRTARLKLWGGARRGGKTTAFSNPSGLHHEWVKSIFKQPYAKGDE